MKELSEILKLCKKGDRIAQQNLYQKTYTELAAAVALFTRNDHDRDWVFNIGMLKIYQNLDRFRIGTNYYGWARTLLVGTAIDHHRKNSSKKASIVPVDFQKGKYDIAVLNDALDKLDTEYLIELIQQLPNQERLIFTLHEIEGFSHVEIEKETGVKENTSKWLLAKARKSLKEKIVWLNKINRSKNGK